MAADPTEEVRCCAGKKTWPNSQPTSIHHPSTIEHFAHTVDDGTNDLMDLAILCRVCAGEALCNGRGEVLLDGLLEARPGKV
jgi:hypothetical protein